MVVHAALGVIYWTLDPETFGLLHSVHRPRFPNAALTDCGRVVTYRPIATPGKDHHGCEPCRKERER